MSTQIPGIVAKHIVISPANRKKADAPGAALEVLRAEYEQIARIRGPDKDNWNAHFILAIEKI